MTDGTVTRAVLNTWRARRLCPHCRLADETALHRAVYCPRWDPIRVRHGLASAMARGMLRRLIGDAGVLTGLSGNKTVLKLDITNACIGDPGAVVLGQVRTNGERPESCGATERRRESR